MGRVGLGLFGVICEPLSHLTYYCEAHSINIMGLRLTQINITSVLTSLATIRLTQLGRMISFQLIDVCSSLLHYKTLLVVKIYF